MKIKKEEIKILRTMITYDNNMIFIVNEKSLDLRSEF